MNKKKWLLLMSSIFTAMMGFAQPIGYMGKIVSVGYAMDGMPGTGKVFQNDKFLDFNTKHSFVVEMAVLKQLGLGFSYQQINDIVRLSKYTVSAQLPIDNSTLSNSSNQHYYSNANFYGSAMHFYCKYFLFKGTGAIAPFGRYIILKYSKSEVDVTDDGRYYSSGKTDLKTLSMEYFMIGYGTQKIYLDRLILDLGVQVGFPRVPFSELNDERKDEVTRISEKKIVYDQLLNIHAGLSFLLF
jgi:hypothetical protein